MSGMQPGRTVFPFTAIVGQERMKQALVLNAINPAIGGVLIRGEKGTAKSTAVRALAPMCAEEPAISDGLVRIGVKRRGGAVMEAVRRLDVAGVGVDDIALRRPTLDDVFLALTGHAAEEEGSE